MAVPTYTQAAYRPFVAPTAPTAASTYTNAYVQPTGSAPVKVKPKFDFITPIPALSLSHKQKPD